MAKDLEEENSLELTEDDFVFIEDSIKENKFEEETFWWYTWKKGDDIKTMRGIDFNSTYDDVIEAYGVCKRKKFIANKDGFVRETNELEDDNGDMEILKSNVFYCQYVYLDEYILRFYFSEDNKLLVIATAPDYVLEEEFDAIEHKFGRWDDEDIEWYEIEKKDDKVLLITKYIIDIMQYNKECGKITWEKCSLRKWLNSSFYDEAFNEEEKNSIIETLVINNSDDYEYPVGGNNTKDKVFLLSADEILKYFNSPNIRKADETYYAKEKGEHFNCYWIRSSDNDDGFGVGYVFKSGEMYHCEANQIVVGVRPALWVKYK